MEHTRFLSWAALGGLLLLMLAHRQRARDPRPTVKPDAPAKPLQVWEGEGGAPPPGD